MDVIGQIVHSMDNISETIQGPPQMPTMAATSNVEAMGMMPGDFASTNDTCDEENDKIPMDILELAQQLVTRSGSVEKAIEAVNTVSEVVDILDDTVDYDENIISQFADAMGDGEL